MVLPEWLIVLCGISSLISIVISISSIYMQLINYRKPFEQRLIIRIQIMVPLYAMTCYISLVSPYLSRFVEPIREIYELFVIYTFVNLLTVMLGGERDIIFFTADRNLVSHPGFMSLLLPPIDISDPHHFVALKKGILQYVWLKPILCVIILMGEFLGIYDVNDMSYDGVYLWTLIVYNLSVTISLYCLALFWKCLYDDLKPFKPWGKFLCVKLIIFASYWQGVILLVLNFIGIIPRGDSTDDNFGLSIQNLLLCFEMIFFSIGHWYSFQYKNFDKRHLPNCLKLQFNKLFKDFIGITDLIVDFKNILNNEFWSYRNFDSIENVYTPQTQSKINRIQQGMRYSHGGTQKYWLPSNSNDARRSFSSEENQNQVAYEEFDEFDNKEFAKDEKLYSYVKRHLPFGDPNYPVVIEADSYIYSRNFQNLRNNTSLKYGNNNNINNTTSYGSI